MHRQPAEAAVENTDHPKSLSITGPCDAILTPTPAATPRATFRQRPPTRGIRAPRFRSRPPPGASTTRVTSDGTVLQVPRGPCKAWSSSRSFPVERFQEAAVQPHDETPACFVADSTVVCAAPGATGGP